MEGGVVILEGWRALGLRECCIEQSRITAYFARLVFWGEGDFTFFFFLSGSYLLSKIKIVTKDLM